MCTKRCVENVMFVAKSCADYVTWRMLRNRWYKSFWVEDKKWDEHISRMASNRLVQIVHDTRLAGKRCPGKPRRNHWSEQDVCLLFVEEIIK